VKTAKYSMVESVFMKTVWQEWAIHLPSVLVKKFVFKKTSKSLEKVQLEMGFDGQNLSLSAELITE
jgi:hypothetical protein